MTKIQQAELLFSLVTNFKHMQIGYAVLSHRSQLYKYVIANVYCTHYVCHVYS